MFNLNFKKETALVIIIFTLFIISPIISFSATTATGSTTADRAKADAEQLKKDQENLTKIREEEDVKNAAELCKSEYVPEDSGSQSGATMGQYVPVHETGELLTLTKSSNLLTSHIDESTGKSYEMDIKLCMYLHAIKRVQYAMEDLTFIQEPDMRRQAATKIEEYKQGLLGPKGLVQTGYKPSGVQAEPAGSGGVMNGTIDKTTLYPENLSIYQNDASDEGYEIFADDLSQSQNSFKSEISAQLTLEKNTTNASKLNSTFSRADYDKFIDPKQASKLSTADWWKSLEATFDVSVPNNPYTSYLYAKKGLDSQQDLTVSVAINEYQTGGGILPIRTCILFTTNGKACRIWKTITPGQITNRAISDALKTRLDEYTSPELGQVGPGNEPNISEIQTFTPSTGAGGGNTGGTGGGNPGKNPSDPNPDPNDPDPNPDPNIPVPPPALFIFSNNLLNNTRRISWETVNVKSCSAKNDWIGSTQAPAQLVTVLKSRGSTLPAKAQNEIVFPLPLKFNVAWSKNGGAYSQSGVSSTTNTASTSMAYTWNVTPPTNANDVYYLNISDGTNANGTIIKIGGVNYPIEPVTAKRVMEMFKSYQSANPNLAIFRRYKFTYNIDARKIMIELIEPTYEISCIGKDGSSVSDSTK